MDAMIKRNRDSKWFTASAEDFGYIMSHEIGHEIDKTIKFRLTTEFQTIYKRERALGSASIEERLSRYGAEAGGNIAHLEHEMIAESWAEYITSSNPRPLSKEVGEAMMKKYYEDNVQGAGTTFINWLDESLKLIR
jgi:hypothetical protein